MVERGLVNAPQQVIKSWQELVANGDNQYVTVNETVLDELAAQNPDLQVPDWRFPGQYADNDWAFATQTIVSSVLNYAFLDKAVPGGGWSMENPEKPGQQIASSNALHTRVNQVFGEAEDITWDQIARLAHTDEFEQFLPGIPLAKSRRRLLADFASNLYNSYGGSVRDLIDASTDDSGNLRAFNDGSGLVERLADDNFGDAFFDYSTYKDLSFPFLKRAQLAPLLIQGRAATSDVLPKLSDTEKIGPIVDYQLPRALRWKKALEYSEPLANDVDNWRSIPADSPKEIEIRGATAYSIDYVMNRTNEIRSKLGQDALNMAHVDFWFWKMGRELKNIENPPNPHFTETTTY